MEEPRALVDAIGLLLFGNVHAKQTLFGIILEWLFKK